VGRWGSRLPSTALAVGPVPAIPHHGPEGPLLARRSLVPLEMRPFFEAAGDARIRRACRHFGPRLARTRRTRTRVAVIEGGALRAPGVIEDASRPLESDAMWQPDEMVAADHCPSSGRPRGKTERRFEPFDVPPGWASFSRGSTARARLRTSRRCNSSMAAVREPCGQRRFAPIGQAGYVTTWVRGRQFVVNSRKKAVDRDPGGSGISPRTPETSRWALWLARVLKRSDLLEVGRSNTCNVVR